MCGKQAAALQKSNLEGVNFEDLIIESSGEMMNKLVEWITCIFRSSSDPPEECVMFEILFSLCNDPVGLPEPQVSVYSLHDVMRVEIYKSFIILMSPLYSAVGEELN